jgi:hypothetical protein
MVTDSTDNGARIAKIINAGVYESTVIIGINQFIIITETAPILPPKPARVPTDLSLSKSLGIVCMLLIEN